MRLGTIPFNRNVSRVYTRAYRRHLHRHKRANFVSRGSIDPGRGAARDKRIGQETLAIERAPSTFASDSSTSTYPRKTNGYDEDHDTTIERRRRRRDEFFTVFFFPQKARCRVRFRT